VTFIRNRVQRRRIADRLGEQVVDEVARWNDQKPDSLAEYGVPVSKREEEIQAQTLEQMAAAELIDEESGSTLTER
jgi:hypothetical protein